MATPLTVVLVGQTGNGKSATANSLLGRDSFVAKRSLKSVTERCEVHLGTLDDGTALRVVDTPGTCDSGALLDDNLKHISEFLRSDEVQGGVHAIVLVLSAAARFTQEEAIAMERLVSRLGEGILAHSLVAFTRGKAVQIGTHQVDPVLKALVFQLVESKVQVDSSGSKSTCTPTVRGRTDAGRGHAG